MTAIGVLRAAYMQGLRVPHDLSVIGLDDIDFAEFTLPPLTTIRLSRDRSRPGRIRTLSASRLEDAGNPQFSASSWSQPAWWSAIPQPPHPTGRDLNILPF